MLRGLKEIVRDNLKYLRNTLSLAVLERKKQYKTSDMGWFWAVFGNFFYIMMFYGAISLGFRNARAIPDIICPYFIWLTAGMTPWFYIKGKVMGGANCFKKNKVLITKIKFPLTCIPTIVCFSDMMIHFIMVGICFIMCFLFGVYPSIYWLQLPFYFALMVLMSYIWSLGAGLLGSISGDFMNFLKAINPAFFWLSGLFFNTRTIEHFQLFFKLNPITYIVEGYRNAIAYHIWFWEDPKSLAYFVLDLFVMLVVALLLYKRLHKRITNYI